MSDTTHAQSSTHDFADRQIDENKPRSDTETNFHPSYLCVQLPLKTSVAHEPNQKQEKDMSHHTTHNTDRNTKTPKSSNSLLSLPNHLFHSVPVYPLASQLSSNTRSTIILSRPNNPIQSNPVHTMTIARIAPQHTPHPSSLLAPFNPSLALSCIHHTPIPDMCA